MLSASVPTPVVDVAVVGGGIIGLSAAWRLRSRGLSVALLERDGLGAGTSAVAGGMLAPVSEADHGAAGARGVALGLASAQRWPSFASELAQASGHELSVRASGTLIVARDRDQAEALDREIKLRDTLGLRTTRLRASEARALEPALAPTVRLALEAPDDHSVEPRSVLAALARAASQIGAALRPGARVRGVTLDQTSTRVTGVELEDGERVSAGAVVVATGPWTGLLGGIPASARVPIRPVKGQTLRLRDPAGPGLIERVLRYEGGWLVPRGDGRYVLGATVEERGYDVSVTSGAILELLRHAHGLVPGVSELVIEDLAVGLRPGTPDNLPAIGLGALEGLVWAVGHHRNGVLLAPLTAEIVTACVLGEPASDLAAACAPGRLHPSRTPA